MRSNCVTHIALDQVPLVSSFRVTVRYLITLCHYYQCKYLVFIFIHFVLYLQIVNAYMALIVASSSDITALDLFFFMDLKRAKPVDKWIQADTFSKSLVIIPVLKHSHFTLVVSNNTGFI